MSISCVGSQHYTKYSPPSYIVTSSLLPTSKGSAPRPSFTNDGEEYEYRGECIDM